MSIQDPFSIRLLNEEIEHALESLSVYFY